MRRIPSGSCAFVVLLAACPAMASIVNNGGFETGSFSDWTVAGYDAPCPNDGLCGVSSATDPNYPIPPYAGSYAAYFSSEFDSSSQDTYLGQTLSSLSPTTSYTLTFFLDEYFAGPSTGYTDSFAVYFGGSTTTGNVTGAQQLYSANNIPLSNGYQEFMLTFTSGLSGSSDLLQFAFYNAPGYFLIDDVAVTPTNSAPEPASSVLLLMGLAGLLGRSAITHVRRSLRNPRFNCG
jgi:hypothetical protein